MQHVEVKLAPRSSAWGWPTSHRWVGTLGAAAEWDPALERSENKSARHAPGRLGFKASCRQFDAHRCSASCGFALGCCSGRPCKHSRRGA